MRKIVLTLICALFISNGVAQTLSFSELIQLKNRDYDHIDTYLTKRGWEYASSTKSTVTWAYGKTLFGDQAEKWFTWIMIENNRGIVDYQFNKDQYEQIKNSINSHGLKLWMNEQGENTIKSIYRNNDITAVLHIKSGIMQNTRYQVIICSNEDYTVVMNTLKIEEEKEKAKWKLIKP